jgi:hypothetical protein
MYIATEGGCCLCVCGLLLLLFFFFKGCCWLSSLMGHSFVRWFIEAVDPFLGDILTMQCC